MLSIDLSNVIKSYMILGLVWEFLRMNGWVCPLRKERFHFDSSKPSKQNKKKYGPYLWYHTLLGRREEVGKPKIILIKDETCDQL